MLYKNNNSYKIPFFVESVSSTFNVKNRITVNIALAVQETKELSQTPFSSRKGVIKNNATIGNISVPKNDTSIERAGRSSAVK